MAELRVCTWSLCVSPSGFLRLDMSLCGDSVGPSWQTDLCTDTSPWHEQYTVIHMETTPINTLHNVIVLCWAKYLHTPKDNSHSYILKEGNGEKAEILHKS